MAVFEHLTDEEVKTYFDKFIAQGMDKDAAFDEVFAIDCNMDEEDEE